MNDVVEKPFSLARLIPLLVLLAVLGLFFYFHLYEYVSLTALKNHRAFLLHWTSQHPFIVVGIYMLIYAIAVGISMPNAFILTMAGGFLFGPVLGTIYVAISATIGACVIFWAAKTALHDLLRAKAGPWMGRMEAGFQHNAVSYMLFLRLVPLFPFSLVNIVPAFFGVRMRTYAVTTFIGILPGTFVYVLLGHGLGDVLEQRGPIDFGIIFRPAILLPILGLAVLSLAPIVYKKIKARRYRKCQ